MEPPAQYLTSFLYILNPAVSAADYFTAIIFLVVMMALITCSAIISGTENAFFSLTRNQIEDLEERKDLSTNAAIYLLNNTKKLLATILIGNTFVNIAFVMVTSMLFNIFFDFAENPVVGFLVEIIFVTFILVLFGEVMPKIYASQNNIKIARAFALPMYYLNKILSPLVWVLVKSTSIIDKRVTKKGHVLSVNELTHAIEITSEEDTPKEEKIILKSIVNFGNINVKQIMRQRPDISALDSSMNFAEVLSRINALGYSRMPVYHENLDNIIGILFTKDLLPHIEKDKNFKWNGLLRKTYFVPESKKIDNLLKEFQSRRVHMAVVVDEYGGTSGLVTMEDILEEIFGEIHDEFDEDENFYSKINDGTYIFEAKILINDMCRFMNINPDIFESIRSEADTLGGMLLELSEELPSKGEQLIYDDFTFIIEAVDQRKIKRVKVLVNNVNTANE